MQQVEVRADRRHVAGGHSFPSFPLGRSSTAETSSSAISRRLGQRFPTGTHRIDEIFAVDDRVITRLTYSGTHRGKLGDLDPTGAHVEYVGAGFFRLSRGLIDEAWVVGDTQEFWRAVGKL